MPRAKRLGLLLIANLSVWEANNVASKSELKRRTKQRELEEKKNKKAAAAPPKAEKQMSAEEAENNLTANVCLPYSKHWSAAITTADSQP